ncbi:hypothetical protein ACB098_08G008600 [Castanea mollissima]
MEYLARSQGKRGWNPTSTHQEEVLSGSSRLVHGPLDGRCKARNWNTLIPLVPVLRFRVCPSVWSVLHTVGQRSLHLFTNYDGLPGPLSSSLFCSLVGVSGRNRGYLINSPDYYQVEIDDTLDSRFNLGPNRNRGYLNSNPDVCQVGTKDI